MILSLFLSVSQAKILMKQNHHAYKTSVMNKNKRDCSGSECQFLNQYLAYDGDQFLAHLDVRTPHGHKLHYLEQVYAICMEKAVALKTRYRYQTNNQTLTKEEENPLKKLLHERKSYCYKYNVYCVFLLLL